MELIWSHTEHGKQTEILQITFNLNLKSAVLTHIQGDNYMRIYTKKHQNENSCPVYEQLCSPDDRTAWF